MLTAIILISFQAGCAAAPSIIPAEPSINTPSLIPSHTPSQTFLPSSTRPSTPTLTPTERPLTLVFYGDSILKVGDIGRQGEVGFSIEDILRASLNPADQIIISNHGGRKAKWGYENLEKNILTYRPDIVTIWWGLNDLGGCPGIFERDTRKIIQYKLAAMIDEHLLYMKRQIDVLLGMNIPVIVITPVPILGTLPWSHFNQNNELVWETDYRCDFNTGLEQLVEAQRLMVANYAAEQKPVYLVDAWQIYKDHPNADKMYMDIVHPGSQGAELIAEGWMHVLQSVKK